MAGSLSVVLAQRRLGRGHGLVVVAGLEGRLRHLDRRGGLAARLAELGRGRRGDGRRRGRRERRREAASGRASPEPRARGRLLALPREVAGDAHGDEREAHRHPRQDALLRLRLDARGGVRGTGGAAITRVAPGRIVAPAPASTTVLAPPTRVGAIVPRRGAVGRRPGPRSTVAPPSGVTPGASVIGIGACVGASRSTSASSTFCDEAVVACAFSHSRRSTANSYGGLVALGEVLGERLLQDRHERVVVGALRDQVEVRLPRG